MNKYKTAFTIIDITEEFIIGFENHLKANNVGQRGRRLYIDLFNAVYNVARKKYKKDFALITNDAFEDFERPKNPVPKKRNISVELLRELLDCEPKSKLAEIGTDILFISFLLCGSNFKDLFYLDNNS